MDKVLITLRSPGKASSLNFQSKSIASFHAPKQSSVHLLRKSLNNRLKLNEKDSYFIFAYGSILNNYQTIGYLYEKFKDKMSPQTGLELQIAEMSTFGFEEKLQSLFKKE